MSGFSYLDIGLTILIVLLAVRSFTRGFVSEFFSLGAPVLGILGGFLFYRNGAEFIRTYYLKELKGLPEILAFVAIFLIVYIVCKILNKILNDVIEGMKLDSIDKILGGIFGILEGIVMVSLVLFILSIQPLFDASAVLENSFYGKIILPIIVRIPKEGLGAVRQNIARAFLKSCGLG